MKRNRTIINSLETPYSCSSQQQYSLSTAKEDDDDDDDAPYSYLPDGCWELIYKFLIQDGNGDEHINSLSLVNKQLLSITNRLRFSLTIRGKSPDRHSFLMCFFRRFTNLNSVNLTCYKGNLYTLLCLISCSPFKLTSLYISNQPEIPRDGLLIFSRRITTLTSLTLSYIASLSYIDLSCIASYFPNLHHLDLSHCKISEQGILHILKICSNITHLNLSGCGMKLRSMTEFQVFKLEVLNLSFATVDDQTLNVISKTCPRILQLLLKYCHHVTHKGVDHVLQNCTQLKEIDLSCCQGADHVNVTSMVLLRPSLRKITVPYHCPVNNKEIELLSRRGCIVSQDPADI